MFKAPLVMDLVTHTKHGAKNKKQTNENKNQNQNLASLVVEW